MSSEKHEDAWELGTGVNYSVNEVYEMMEERFGKIEKIHIPNQSGNYPSTLRENFDTLTRLGWSPSDKLKSYIQSL
jgi:nucleoside-diphosphate-sugar epimerase